MVGGILTLILALSTWIYWRAFWVGWDHAVTNRQDPARVQVVELGSLTVAAIACVGLMIGAVVAGRSKRAALGP